MPRNWSRIFAMMLLAGALIVPRVTFADDVLDYFNDLVHNQTSPTDSSITPDTTDSGTPTPDTTDPLKDYLQFDPYANGTGLTSVAALTYLSGAKDPVTITYRFINIALSFLGLVSTAVIMYAGGVWFFSRDNEEKATEAKQILFGAVIGLIITLGSLSLSVYLYYITAAVTGGT